MLLEELVFWQISRDVLHPLHHEEAKGADEAQDDHDQELPGQQQVATVEERHCCKDRLNKLEDGKGWCALLSVNSAQNAVELSVEAAVSESKQEAAQHSDGDTWRQIRLLLRAAFKHHWSIIWYVEEDQVEGHKMHHHTEEDD